MTHQRPDHRQFAAYIVVLFSACSVDDRVLETSNGGRTSVVPTHRDSGTDEIPDGGEPIMDGGSGRDASTGAGGMPEQSDGGDTPPPLGPVDPPVGDACEVAAEQLIIDNARFDNNATGWSPDGSSSRTWSNNDATANDASGSLSVTNEYAGAGVGLSSAGSSQCLSLAARSGYHVCVDYRIDGAAQAGAAAGVNVVLFNEEDCKGTVSSNHTLPTASEIGDWHTLKAQLAAPPLKSSFKSMLIKLVSVKPHEEAEQTVLFDNIRIGRTPP